MKVSAAAALFLLCGTAHAQVAGDAFVDDKDGGKVHKPSGFVCPAKIGMFERDAVGDRDSASSASFCAYSERDGLYGTVTLRLLSGPYDPKAALAPDFSVQEGLGARRVAEATVQTQGSKLGIYTRTYETTKLESLHYKILFSAASVGNWGIETTIEYADPRDNAAQKDFLNAVYTAALKEITSPSQSIVSQVPSPSIAVPATPNAPLADPATGQKPTAPSPKP